MEFIYFYGFYFFIYAFLGWCCEVAYATVKQRRFVNRGFLFGIVCPIYGVGVCIVLLTLSPVKDNLLLLYISAVIVTSAIEFVTGWLLERFFNEKWWDYSNSPMNIKGYICLPFSLIWGVCCVIVVKFIQLPIAGLIKLIPRTMGIILLSLFAAAFLTDLCLTLISVMKLRKTAALALDLERALTRISEHLGENISDAVLSAIENKERNEKRFEEFKEKYNAERRAKNLPSIEELRQKYKDAAKRRHSLTAKRLGRAFPNLRNKKILNFEEKRRKKRK